MSRPFNSPNEQLPACVVKLGDNPPPCFDKVMWVSWLQSSWSGALNDPAARKRMERGQAPEYCEECLVGHQRRMLAQGRCFPTPPKYELREAKQC